MQQQHWMDRMQTEIEQFNKLFFMDIFHTNHHQHHHNNNKSMQIITRNTNKHQQKCTRQRIKWNQHNNSEHGWNNKIKQCQWQWKRKGEHVLGGEMWICQQRTLVCIPLFFPGAAPFVQRWVNELGALLEWIPCFNCGERIYFFRHSQHKRRKVVEIAVN